jgi:hypothetical protein
LISRKPISKRVLLEILKVIYALPLVKHVDLMTTPLEPTFRKLISDSVEQLLKQQVTPWAFFAAGSPFQIKSFDGGQIAYQGVEFEGSPRLVFWTRYIEPFLEELCVSQIGRAVAMARERDVDARLLLPEVQGLLLAGFRTVYAGMVEIDRRLRGKGFPNRVERRSTEQELQTMERFLDERIHAELAMWRGKSSFESWYERNKVWVWAIGIVISVVGLLAKLL